MKKATEQCRDRLSRGEPLESVLAGLREAGLSKGQSIKVLADAAGKTLSEAKELVHFSEAWADVRTRDEEFHAELLEQIENLPDQ